MNSTESTPTPAQPPPEPPPTVDPKQIDLRLRRAELEQELEALTRKSKSYSFELVKDGQHLLGSSWDYAKAFLTVNREKASAYAQKVLRKDRERPHAA